MPKTLMICSQPLKVSIAPKSRKQPHVFETFIGLPPTYWRQILIFVAILVRFRGLLDGEHCRG
jgi:hypothetical protein